MATPVVMEALSPTMEEGRVAKWHKHEGDAVKAGDVLAEVETDKAIMDLVARADGVLGTIAVREGETVPVGKELAVIAAPGESGGGKREARSVQAPAEASRPAAPAPPPVSAPAAPTPVAAAPAPPPVSPPLPASRMPLPAPPDATRVKASPLARRMAKEAGVDLKLVPGSGPGGRVIGKDLEGVRGSVVRGASAPITEPAPAPEPSLPPATHHAPSGAAYEDIPLSPLRKTIAKRLATSLGPVPHFFLTTDIDMERAAEERAALNERLEGDARVSVNSLVLKATALALKQHRACNAWFADDHIRYWNEVHLGMAVAVEDGLITPVIHNADLKSLSEIGGEARELAVRARARRLRPAEYTGATFSVSNLGMFDIDQFTAVLNPPEAGILAVGSVEARPTVVNGEIRPRRRMRVTMSCDHRVIDGATGAAFLKTLKQMLENPLAML
jgi:pyruvate dehydrogenase E2 component (dihydrolipoamide acetyltransferase)